MSMTEMTITGTTCFTFDNADKYVEECAALEAEMLMNRAESETYAATLRHMISVPDEDYANLYAEATKNKAGFKTQGRGESYVTTFKIVEGKLYAYEPEWPAGREVVGRDTRDTLADTATDMKIVSYKGILMKAFTEAGATSDCTAIEYWRRLLDDEGMFDKTDVYSAFVALRMMRDIGIIPVYNNGVFMFGAMKGKNVPKDEFKYITAMLMRPIANQFKRTNIMYNTPKNK